jgi:hypothetical protein
VNVERWHGTSGGYTNHKCRCDECRAAWRAYISRRRAERYAEVNGGPASDDVRAKKLADVKHGTESTYTNWGCRCRPCTDGHNAYCRAARQRRASA